TAPLGPRKYRHLTHRPLQSTLLRARLRALATYPRKAAPAGWIPTRTTTDDCIRIALPDLKRLDMIKRHCMNRRTLTWTSDGRIVAQLTLVSDVDCHEPYPYLKITGHAHGSRVDCLVWLDNAPMRFGGEQWYALCPHTGRQCTTLVLLPGKTHFASVRGWGVAYGSQRECEVRRAYRAIDKASRRLRGLSKYARKPTRERLKARLLAKHLLVEDGLDRLARGIW
ncbi:hypothetical protein, partial [Novosphingobium sp. PASSN1]|uniref:hypothetical protein n=1 Tax=Novosphingobium sp. PASSN1 TaxID=2015561 RepID=UPI000BCABD3E